MYIVGITGGIGSGKNAVTTIFQEQGIDVVDADIAARRVVKPGMPAYEEIVDYFGVGVLLPSGGLNRKALRAIIFSDPQKRIWLELLLHPLIEEWIIDRLNSADSAYTVLSSPLLLETKQYQLCQRVMVIDVAESTQIQRTTSRDNTSAAQVRAIIANQAPREKRRQGADDIVDNDGSLEQLRHNIDQLHQRYLDLASAHHG